MLRWETKKERQLQERLEQSQQDHIKSLEKVMDSWKQLAIETEDKYIDLLVKSIRGTP